MVAGPELLPRARAVAEQVLAEVDRSCSRFREDSDLVRANRAAGSWVRVDPLLVRAVQAALTAAEATDGLVDPTLGLSLEALGYDADLAVVQARGAGAPGAGGPGPAALPRPAVPDAWQQVQVDPGGAVLVPEGVALDLGATGKAFAADLVAAAVARDPGAACVVSLGGDVAVGVPGRGPDGGPGRTPDGGSPHGWHVGVGELPEPQDPAGPQEVVVLEAGGLATSTTLRRRWSHAGTAVHHLLDPRTGRPVERRWRTASVAAATCVEANTASTAALILGAEAPEWLEVRGLPSRLVAQDGSVMHCGGWPAEDAAVEGTGADGTAVDGAVGEEQGRCSSS